MKCLVRTKKEFTKEAIKRIEDCDIFYSGNDKFIARIRVPFESELVKKNIDCINKALNNNKDYITESDLNKIYDYPILNYLDYYNTIISYKVKNIDGKLIREAIINDELKEAVTDYFVTVGPFDLDTDINVIVLTGLYIGEEMDLWDYESIHSLIPNIVDKLVNEGYAIIDVKEV